MAFLVPLVGAIGSGLSGVVGAATSAVGSLGTALSLGSTVLGAVGAIQQGRAQADAANYNAAVQKQQADTENTQAGVRATEIANRTRQRVAATRAGALENGFETDGSVADILNTVETQGALEGLTTLYDGSERAKGLRASAELNKSNAKSSLMAGYLNAGTSLLSGFSNAYT